MKRLNVFIFMKRRKEIMKEIQYLLKEDDIILKVYD